MQPWWTKRLRSKTLQNLTPVMLFATHRMRYFWQFLATQVTETFKLRKSWTICKWTATTYGSADSDQPPYTVRCRIKIGTPTRNQQLGDSISSLSVWTERHFIFTALCDVDICCVYISSVIKQSVMIRHDPFTKSIAKAQTAIVIVMFVLAHVPSRSLLFLSCGVK